MDGVGHLVNTLNSTDEHQIGAKRFGVSARQVKRKATMKWIHRYVCLELVAWPNVKLY